MLTTFAVVAIRNRPEEALKALQDKITEERIIGGTAQLVAVDRIGHIFQVVADDLPPNRNKLIRLFGEYNMVSESAKEDDRQRERILRRIAKLQEEIVKLQEALGE